MIDTDEMIRVKNRVGLVIDLIFRGDDIVIVKTWDKDFLAGGLDPNDYQSYEEFKAGETDYAFLASSYQFSLSL